jgi:hypothetical protein
MMAFVVMYAIPFVVHGSSPDDATMRWAFGVLVWTILVMLLFVVMTFGAAMGVEYHQACDVLAARREADAAKME